MTIDARKAAIARILIALDHVPRTEALTVVLGWLATEDLEQAASDAPPSPQVPDDRTTRFIGRLTAAMTSSAIGLEVTNLAANDLPDPASLIVKFIAAVKEALS